MTAKQRRDLLEIVEGRYGGASTMLIGQLRFSRGHDVIGEPTLPTVRARAGAQGPSVEYGDELQPA